MSKPTTGDPQQYADQVIAEGWPQDGPYETDQAKAALDLAGELLRWANHATRRKTVTPRPAAVYELIGKIDQLHSRLPQLLEQLAGRLDELGSDPDVYHDEPGEDPAESAAAAALDLRDVGRALQANQSMLRSAHSLTSHLGIRLRD